MAHRLVLLVVLLYASCFAYDEHLQEVVEQRQIKDEE